MAAEYDLVIEQGSDFALELEWQTSAGAPMPYPDYEFIGQIREAYDSPVAMDFQCSMADDISHVIVAAPAARTAELDFDYGVWDLEAHHTGGSIVRLVGGKVTVSREVTKLGRDY